jgi:ribosomal protein S18 acetylase RimI-like enzyme
MKSKIQIRKGTIEECMSLADRIPEFYNNYPKEEYLKRLNDTYCSIWIAECTDNNLAVGFKLGYEKEKYFYSWLGGVIPEYRNRGVAKLLARMQEIDCLQNHIQRIRFKTYNRFREMLIFGLKNGFEIIDFERKTGKITLEKIL